MEPLRDKCLVTLLPPTARSSLLTMPDKPTPIRRARCEAVGPDAIPKGLCVGITYLVNILNGQEVGDQLLLPYQSFLAEWEE